MTACGKLGQIRAGGMVVAAIRCDRFAGHEAYGEPHGASLTWPVGEVLDEDLTDPGVGATVTEAPTAYEPHDHRPVQHRDGKPPWCGTCGLTASMRRPVSRFGR